jgi:DNA-binding NtrC family response regulator
MSLTSNGKLLILDDDPGVLLSLRLALKGKFPRLRTESDPERIREIVQDDPFDVVLLDMNFQQGDTSGNDGLYWLKKIRFLKPDAAVIMMTAYADIGLAVSAMKEGAVDFVTKPWNEKGLLESVELAMQRVIVRRRQRQSRQLPGSQRSLASPAAQEFVGDSACVKQLIRLVGKVGPSEANVLILGEKGSGKETIARELHRLSPRGSGPFISIDLEDIPEQHIASELFGQERGMYSELSEDRVGRLEAANGGTLFIDGICRLGTALQSRLLQVIRMKEISRPGDHRPIPLDIRIICGSILAPDDPGMAASIRKDLMNYIHTVEIHIPALRERTGDISLLTAHFLSMFARKYRQPHKTLSPDALDKLEHHSWPGNVRELQHTLERAVILSEGSVIGASELSLEEITPSQPVRDSYNLQELERTAIHQAIEKHGGNLSRAARDLGLGRTTLYRKLEKYGI